VLYNHRNIFNKQPGQSMEPGSGVIIHFLPSPLMVANVIGGKVGNSSVLPWIPEALISRCG
jgi:hypothetical protein